VDTPVIELSRKIIALIGSRSPIERGRWPVDDPVQRLPRYQPRAAISRLGAAVPL